MVAQETPFDPPALKSHPPSLTRLPQNGRQSAVSVDFSRSCGRLTRGLPDDKIPVVG
jgi:hypothetical protein